jgi:transposase-like protein
MNNLLKQDHRAIKPIIRLMFDFKSSATLRSIERIHMLKKDEMIADGEKCLTQANWPPKTP